MFNVSSENIANVDETPIYFDMPEDITVDTVGSKTLSIITYGNEKQHFTVVLLCQSAGNKLRTIIIFKRKNT